MRKKLRALVVDDSAIYRSLVQGCLRKIDDVECVGAARDGQDAIEKAAELSPDLILLDVEMPVMNGLEAIPELRARVPESGIIMVSSITTQGADVTLEALQSGAFDFVTKPKVKAGEDGFAALREPLEAVIAAFQEGRRARTSAPPKALPKRRPDKLPNVDLIAIGVSTGGPSALAEVIPALPADLPMPVVVVQHMPARFTASLAASLHRKSQLRVTEGRNGQPLGAGDVVIAPGGRHLLVSGGGDTEPHVLLIDDEPVHSFRPSVDVLFRSLVDAVNGRALCVVMTGMGSDGCEGVAAVRAAGGYCVAQDQASCAVFGMPRSVIEGGHADEVVALSQLAARIQEIATGS